MTDIKTDFFVTGGTLRRDALSYIVRDADEKDYDGLLKGEFCYVLTPRQMGKSSLMVRTAVRLGDAGVTVAVLDLTGIGSNLTAEQWYEGLLNNIGTQLDLEDELDDYWDDNAGRSPLQRWLGAVRKIVLPTVEKQLVIFVDEIDMVRSLPFSTDEFFASIREFHNSRSINADSDKITFCLLGVAAPADLISNPLITPFNIGSRIELKDFTDAQSEQLAEGVNKGGSSLEIVGRVLHWTGGHPYLTQKMCQSISSKDEIRTVNQVDDLCHKMFLSSQARDKDINLSFVRDRMLKSDDDIATLLDIYSRVYKDMHVPANEKNPVFDTLILSGIVRINDGEFRISNRIYKHVFDKAWVVEHMPGAELRRQKREFWRGVIRTAAVAVIVIGIIAGLAVYSIVQRERALRGELLAKQYLYDAEINLASKALEDGNLGRSYELLEKNKPRDEVASFVNWEWYHLWNQSKNDHTRELGSHNNSIRSIALSPDDNLLATAGEDSFLILTNLKNGEKNTFDLNSVVTGVDFSPEGDELAYVTQSASFGVINLTTLKNNLPPFKAEEGSSVKYSKDGKYLGVIGEGELKLYNRKEKKITIIDHVRSGYSMGMDFSYNGKYIAHRSTNSVPQIFDLNKKRNMNFGGLPEKLNNKAIYTVRFNKDSTLLYCVHWGGYISIWDVDRGVYLSEFKGHNAWVGELLFTPDGKTFFTASADQSIKIWNAKDNKLLGTLTGHRNEVWGITLNSSGTTLYSGSKDMTFKEWDPLIRDSIDNTHHRDANDIAARLYNNGSHYVSISKAGVIKVKKSDEMEDLLSIKDVKIMQSNSNMPDLESLSYFAISPNLEHLSYVGEKQKVVLRGLKYEKEITIDDMEASKFSWPFTVTLSFSKDSQILRALCSDGYKEYNQNNGKLTSHIKYENVIGFFSKTCAIEDQRYCPKIEHEWEEQKGVDTEGGNHARS